MTNNKFKSYDDGIDMSDINAMFRERDAMKIVNNYEPSTMTSVTRRRPRRKKKSPNGYIVALAAIVAAGGITLAASTIDITPKGSLHDFGRDVGSIVYVKDDDFNPRYDSTNISIVSQNTKRNANTYYYDQDGIAKDLVSLDDRLLDITFVSVCEDMGEHLNNKVGSNGETNIDLVISGIKKYAEEGSYAEKDFKDINSLNEWLVKRGYVDKKGSPDLQSAINHYVHEQSIFDHIVSEEIQEKEEGVGLK